VIKVIRTAAAHTGLLAALIVGPRAACADPVVVVQDGTARVAIHASPELMADDQRPPDNALAATAERHRRRLRESVRDLSIYLERIGGAPIPVRTEPPRSDDSTIPILVGRPAEVRFQPIANPTEFRQAFRVVVSPTGIGLLGETDEAASYAVYELLDELGCRWHMPGELGELVPRRATIAFPERDVTIVPRTASRNIWYADDAYRRRNRLGGFAYSAGHALEGYVTKEQLERHPEWNAEIGGTRALHRCDVGYRICWANAEVAGAVADTIIANLDKNPATPCVSISPGDGVDFCECAQCKELDTGDWDASLNCVSITDRYIHFCNRVAERVVARHPNVKLGFLAYVQFTRPPLREKLHPALIPQLAPITYCRAHTVDDGNCSSRQTLRGILEGWGKACRNMAMYEYAYHLAEVSAPCPMIARNVRELPLQYANGVTMWTPETLPSFDTGLPGLWLGIRMAWSADADPTAILDEFHADFYGAASSAMRAYWDAVDGAWTTVPEHAGSCFGYMSRFTPDRLADLRQRMDAALASCVTVPEYRRVTLANQSLRQFERFMAMRRDYFAGRFRNLEDDARRWTGIHQGLAGEYENNFAFTKTNWASQTVSVVYADAFCFQSYNEAAHLSREYDILAPIVTTWTHAEDKEKRGEELGWHAPDFDDSAWKKTDVASDTWADLGLFDYYGTVWYRRSIDIASIPAGKKVLLWVGATDGRCKVFVNGRHVPFIGSDGKQLAEAESYCRPFSFDVTTAVRPGANSIALACARTAQNELGTGGLLGPVVIGSKK